MKMKKNILMFICMPMLLACKKQETLPPQTAQGSNNFGCYVNGLLFTPALTTVGANFGEQAALSLTYGKLIEIGSEVAPAGSEKYIFRVEGRRQDKGVKKSVGVSALNIKGLKAGDSLPINNKVKGNFMASYKEERGDNLTIFTASEGTITILKVTDTFVAGVFWFIAEDSAGNKVNISEGRFDVTYLRKNN